MPGRLVLRGGRKRGAALSERHVSELDRRHVAEQLLIVSGRELLSDRRAARHAVRGWDCLVGWRVDLFCVFGWLVPRSDGPDELLAVPSGQLLLGSRDGANSMQPGLILVEWRRK